jgi:hypothetical protein
MLSPVAVAVAVTAVTCPRVISGREAMRCQVLLVGSYAAVAVVCVPSWVRPGSTITSLPTSSACAWLVTGTGEGGSICQVWVPGS